MNDAITYMWSTRACLYDKYLMRWAHRSIVYMYMSQFDGHSARQLRPSLVLPAATRSAYIACHTSTYRTQTSQVIKSNICDYIFHSIASAVRSYSWMLNPKKVFVDIRFRPLPRYCNATRGRPSHGHRGSAQQLSWRSVQRLQRHARRQTHTHRHTYRQTRWSQYSAPLPGRSNE